MMIAAGSAGHAQPVTPTGTFGTLAAATFGGSGIPNNAVEIATIVDGGRTITIGLTAHQRYVNPPLTNDGAGTFFAGTGANFGNPALPGGPGPSAFQGATWNFAYYVQVSGGTIGDYNIDLFYDFDPGKDTVLLSLGRVDFDLAAPALALVQDSKNLMFGDLAGIPPLAFVTPPSGSFDPFAAGEYSFLLRVSAAGTGGAELGRVAINVNVVPEPATMAVLLAGLTGLLLSRRRAPAA